MSKDSSKNVISSTAFPTASDLKQWHSLSVDEQQALILRDVKEGLDGPAADRAGKSDLIADVLSEYVKAS